MAGVLGYAITLRCPALHHYAVINNITTSVIKWFRGPISDPKSTVARLVTKGVHVEKNFTADTRMWISSMDGDLIIHNLMLEDAGFYNCSFTGSNPRTVQLNVVTGIYNSQT